jgi:alpha/beta superfamily hydrolase
MTANGTLHPVQPHDLAPAAEPWASALLLHPHPDYGGDRHNIVVDALYRALPPAGVTALRFDFAGSDPDEATADTVALLDLLTSAPRFLIGYSFGAYVASRITDDRVGGWFLVAPPHLDAAAEHDPRPKGFALPERDQFRSPDLAAALEGWTNSSVGTVPGADHFLVGHTAAVVQLALSYLRTAGR